MKLSPVIMSGEETGGTSSEKKIDQDLSFPHYCLLLTFSTMIQIQLLCLSVNSSLISPLCSFFLYQPMDFSSLVFISPHLVGTCYYTFSVSPCNAFFLHCFEKQRELSAKLESKKFHLNYSERRNKGSTEVLLYGNHYYWTLSAPPRVSFVANIQ